LGPDKGGSSRGKPKEDDEQRAQIDSRVGDATLDLLFNFWVLGFRSIRAPRRRLRDEIDPEVLTNAGKNESMTHPRSLVRASINTERRLFTSISIASSTLSSRNYANVAQGFIDRSPSSDDAIQINNGKCQIESLIGSSTRQLRCFTSTLSAPKNVWILPSGS
jgi:hypothetical protein